MQAFLITAYKDKEQLLRLIGKVNKIGKVYVHIDTKSEELKLDELEAMHLSNTCFFCKYKVFWGSYRHVEAILFLIQRALEDKDLHYFHLISGQDYPIVNKTYFEKRFNTECKDIYMSCSDKTLYDQGVRERYGYWYPCNSGNPKGIFYRLINRLAVSVQKLFHMERTSLGQFDDVYKGMIWTSMPRKPIEYVMQFLNTNPSFVRKLKHVKLAEEFIFQTILMNSEYKDSVIRSSLRYNDWMHAVGGSPAIIDEEMYDAIIAGDYCFARKMQTGKSEGLIDIIENRVTIGEYEKSMEMD